MRNALDAEPYNVKQHWRRNVGDGVPTSRNARNPETGENYKVDGSMSFNEWKESLTPEQKDAMEQHVKQMRNKSADRKQFTNAEKCDITKSKMSPRLLDGGFHLLFFSGGTIPH